MPKYVVSENEQAVIFSDSIHHADFDGIRLQRKLQHRGVFPRFIPRSAGFFMVSKGIVITSGESETLGMGPHPDDAAILMRVLEL